MGINVKLFLAIPDTFLQIRTISLFRTITVIYIKHFLFFYSNMLWPLNSELPETKIAEFANSTDLDEVAHNEPPHLDQHSLPSSL